MIKNPRIGYVFANTEFESRGLKFIESSIKNSYGIIKFLRRKNESYFSYVLRTVKSIHLKNPDIIHAHRISGFIPAMISKLTGSTAKIIYDKHDIHRYDIIFDRLIFLSDYVIVASDLHLQRIRKITRKSDVIHNYSNFSRADKNTIKKIRRVIGLKKDDIAILFQGSIVPEYGLDMLLCAIENFPTSVKIIIMGWIKDKIYWNFCKNKFQRRVIYLKSKSFNEMPKYVSSADIGVVLFKKSKLTEYGNPNKLFEFLSCKVPVVVTDLPSLSPYVKNGINGFVVKNMHELENSIMALMNKNLRKRINNNSLPNLKWSSEFEKYKNIVDKLCIQ